MSAAADLRAFPYAGPEIEGESAVAGLESCSDALALAPGNELETLTWEIPGRAG